MFHAGNAYDAADGTVVMDVVRYESMFYTNSLSAFEDEARLYRWTANPATRRVSEQLLDDHAQEFPRHDDRLTGQDYRYSYTITSDDVPRGFTGLLKYDDRSVLDWPSRRRFSCQSNCQCRNAGRR